MAYKLKSTSQVCILAGALLLGGCHTTQDHSANNAYTGDTGHYSSYQSRTSGDRPSLVVSNSAAADVIYNEGSRDVLRGRDGFSSAPISSNTKTLVGRKISELSRDVRSLDNDIDAKSAYLTRLHEEGEVAAEGYYSMVAAISADLQSGSTPGNPDLVDRWNTAQKRLNALAESSGALNNLAGDIGSDASRAAYLLESTRATFNLSGAREEDHERLTDLEDEVNETIVRIDRLINRVNDETSRRTTYLRTERLNMQTLSLAIANGDLYGQNISNRLFRRAAQPAAGKADVGPLTTTPTGRVANRKPMVIIRFDRPDLEYEQALFGALSTALERRPDAQFDLVAVSPSTSNAAETALFSTAARKNGEAVLRSLTQMGVPMERVNLNATSSTTALNSEVHLYIR